MKQLFFALLLPFSLSWSATLKGRVIWAGTNEPLIGATVRVEGTRLGASCGISGNFIIKDLPPGRIILTTGYIGCISRKDTLIITREDEEVWIDLKLKCDVSFEELQMQLLSAAERVELKSYQDSLVAIARRMLPLSITIDSLYCDPKISRGEDLFAIISMHNNCDIPIYVLKNYPCLRRISTFTVEPGGDTLRTHVAVVDFIGEKCRYEWSDLICIPPKSTLQYPKTHVWPENCKYMTGQGSPIRLEYEYERPVSAGVELNWDPGNLLPYLKAIEGRFVSENAWRLVK